jgi:DNA-binding transcriptional LysR family regulator
MPPASPLEVRHLRALRAVHEHGRLSLAAESIQLSQPALSRTLQGLEQIIGEPVLDRSTRPATITRAGYRVLAMSEPVFTAIEGITGQVQGAAHSLRLGVMLSTGWRQLVEAMAPDGSVGGLTLDIMPFGLEDGFEALRTGHVDAAIAYFPLIVPDEFSSHEIARGPAAIAIPGQHPAARGDSCTMGAIGRGPMFVARHHPEWAVNFEALLRARGLEPPEFVDVINLFEAVERISRGEGIAVSAGANDFPYHPGVAVLTISDFEIVRQGLLWPAGPMPDNVRDLVAALMLTRPEREQAEGPTDAGGRSMPAGSQRPRR